MPADEARTGSTWSVQPVVVVLAAVGAALGLALTVFASDAAGRLLFALATAGLTVASVLGASLRPRLAADAHGLAVRGLNGTTRLRWADVERVDITRTRRLGRTVNVLEISPRDTVPQAPALLVLTHLDLGVDPQLVYNRLLTIRMGPD